MALHAAAMIAGFVDQLAQAPVVVQCAQAAPDPWWKWPLQFALSVVPVAGGVWVAWMAFRWTSNKEQKQWIRDQKAQEWKQLIELSAEFESLMPLGEPGKSTIDAVRWKVLPLCDRMARRVSESLFVAPSLAASKIRSDISETIHETNRAIGRIENYGQCSPDEKMALGSPLENAAKARIRLQRLHMSFVSLAQKDLHLKDSDEI